MVESQTHCRQLAAHPPDDTTEIASFLSWSDLDPHGCCLALELGAVKSCLSIEHNFPSYFFTAHPFQRACTHQGPHGTCHIITLWLHLGFQLLSFPGTDTWDKPLFRAGSKTTHYEFLFENTACALLIHRIITNKNELHILLNYNSLKK